MRQPTHRVTLKAYSAVHIRERDVLRIDADAVSTGPIQCVTYQSAYNQGLPSTLEADVYLALPSLVGDEQFDQAVEAVQEIGHDFHLLALLFNAAVNEPEVTGIYRLASNGEYRMQGLAAVRPHGEWHARQTRADTLFKIIRPLPRRFPDRLQAALMIYDYGLCALHPFNTVEAALRLYPCIENLTAHIQSQLQEQTCLSPEDHARSLGIDVQADDWRYQYRGKVRRDHIFAEDPGVFRALRVARNEYEHASVNMDDLRARLTPIVTAVYRQVRRAILAQLPLDLDGLEVVLRPDFDPPLGNWPTRAVVGGTFSGPNDAFAIAAPRLELEASVTQAHFAESQDDLGAGVRRGQLTYGVAGSAKNLPTGVVAHQSSVSVAAPRPWADIGEEVESPTPDLVRAEVDGRDVTAEARGEAQPPPST